MKQFILLLAIASIAYVSAECPNACSGHGDCEAFDQCNCYRGWMAADCSDKQCAMGLAFTTTPQGDLNMDGDREDNSQKQLSEPGVIRINTNTITFARSGLQKNELKVGDGLRICNEDFIVTQLRGRVITGKDDFKDKSEDDDTTSEITSATADTYKRRIKEVVLNTRHTQNCGTLHDGTGHSTVDYAGQITKGDGDTDPKFTKSAGNAFDATKITVGARVYVWCTGTDAGLFKSSAATYTGVNNYGYLEDGVYKDGGRFLTVKAVTTSIITFEERIGHNAGASPANTCHLKLANDHIVYRQLTTQARPNGDWEKWKGDFKGTNTRPGRGPTMNNYEQATYERLGKDYSSGDSIGLGDYGQDEGHFYMECSNQGLCDRKTGLCECFDGYTGRACQRQSCPDDCSGHGVCLSVDQLRTAEMTKIGMTCYTKRDSKVVSCDSDVMAKKLRANDYVKIGNFPPMKIASIAISGVVDVLAVTAVSTSGTTFKVTEGTYGSLKSGMKVYKNSNILIGKLAQDATNSGNNGDEVTLDANAAVSASIGDTLTFYSSANTDNYNTTHFLSGLTPTNDRANKVDTFTLYNAFPESTPYGTEIWQVHAYDLWDSNKNMACKCDPRWTGYDCSERKCPLGDDPLTVDAVDGQGTSTTTDDSSYTQAPEKQTLVINSGQTEIGSTTSVPTGMLIGHFTLAFEDYFGETFVTRPIPLEVEMSVTVSAAADGLVVLFDGAEGLPVGELSRGDEIRIGRDIRFVETITFVDHNTKTHIKSFVVRDEYLGATLGGEKFHGAHASGSRLYRRDVSKEIREALLDVPNARVEGVSVEKLEISGDYVGVNTATYGVVDSTNAFGKATTAVNTAIGDNWKVGDLIRIRSHIRVVTDFGTNLVGFHGSMGTMGTNAAAFQLPYRAAMQKYRIKFESGCMTDDHCNHNGVNSYDSDAGATCSLGGSCYCSLPTGSKTYTFAASAPCTTSAAVIPMTASTADIKKGMAVTKSGVLVGYVASVIVGTSVTMTANALVAIANADSIVFNALKLDQYHGFGCTRKGKGNDFHGTPRAINHARPYKRSNSGDIPLMQCDKDEIFSGKLLNSYGSVNKATPTKIDFGAAYIDSQQYETEIQTAGDTTQADLKLINNEDLSNLQAGMTAHKSDGSFFGYVKSTANSDGNTPTVTLKANLVTASVVGDKVVFGTPLFTDLAVGNEVYVDGQVRTIVERAATWVKVDTPFTIYSKSNDDYIVPSGSSVYQINRLGGVGNTCQLTDMPRITSHDLENTDSKGTLATVNANDGTVVGDDSKSKQTNPHTEVTIRPMDPQEIEIGDRIRIDTDTDSDSTGGTGLTPGTYITHTVDKIVYETLPDDSAANAVTVPGGIAKFTLNEIVSVESTTTGNMVPVTAVDRFIYNDQRGTTENKECSGRGLCDESAGTCSCFKGYTDDDCSRQNALASK